MKVLKDAGNVPAIEDRYLTISEVMSIVRLSRASIYRLMKEGLFPRPFRIGKSAVRWRESALRKFIEEREVQYANGVSK